MNTPRNKRILVLGSTGLLGSSLCPSLEQMKYSVLRHGHREGDLHADLADPLELSHLLQREVPDVIVNLVGLTDVERCEAEPNVAFTANALTVKNIVGWIKQSHPSCHLLHISTDQVYDGPGQHSEEQVTLRNYYAFSKYAGELIAAEVPSTILRTNFFGRSRCASRSSFTDWLYGGLTDLKPLQVFDDVLFSPLSMETLAQMLTLAIEKKPLGVLNLGTNKGMSKADFAFAFAEELSLPTEHMTRTSVEQAAFLKARRPKNMLMDNSAFELALEIHLPDLSDEIKKVVPDYAKH